MDPIKIESGYISGTVLGEPGKEVRVYRGIPYAAPPVGDLRWKPPQPVAPWSGTRECTEFQAAAPQKLEEDLVAMVPLQPLSEDCLYLNVQTPAKKAADKFPVMVWMHGGGYELDSGNNPTYNNYKLPQHGVVLVTVNMRLGPVGLLAHPLLSRESPGGVSGNYMFLDMIAALEWVQRNISAFGGDPGKVTIFGESGGGAKVTCLTASPLAKGLFHRTICESGTSGGFSPGKPMKELEGIGEKFFAKLGADKESDPLKASRAVPWERILETEQALAKDLDFTGPGSLWDSAVDGWFLSDTPANIFRAGKQNAVSLITCANLGELTNPVMSLLFSFLIPDYVNMLSGVNKAGGRAYACIFDQVPAGWRKQGAVSTHMMELTYVFGNVDDQRDWDNLFFLTREAGAKSNDPGATDVDRKVSENMMTIWAQFAKTGTPSVKGLVTWPAWEAATDQYLYISEPLQVKSGFSRIAQEK